MMTNGSWPCGALSPHAEVRGFREPFAFELWGNPSWRFWGKRNWTLCFWISALYVAAVLLGQRLMRDRPALHLRRPLLAWNLLVATYSLLAGYRVSSEILAHARRDGFLASICALGPVEHQMILGTYALFFTLSKVAELADTAFLVLRRKPVPLQHCFHHTLVLIGTWSYMAYPSVVGIYFAATNHAVHFLVYSHLTLKMLRFHQPPVVVPLLAALEMLHVLGGLGVTLYAAHAKRSGAQCCLFPETVSFFCTAYVAFAVVSAKATLDATRLRTSCRFWLK